jgi:hypothetical protein
MNAIARQAVRTSESVLARYLGPPDVAADRKAWSPGGMVTSLPW